MKKEYKTYHRLEGTERAIDRNFKTICGMLSEGSRATKFAKAISLKCTKTEWDMICSQLTVIEWQPKFGII